MLTDRRTRFAVQFGLVVAVLTACSTSEIVDRLEPSESQPVVTLRIEGPGTVRIADPVTDCRTTCTVEVPPGTQLEIRALPDEGTEFIGWAGACTGADGCLLEVDSDVDVEATFAARDETGSPPAPEDGGSDGGSQDGERDGPASDDGVEGPGGGSSDDAPVEGPSEDGSASDPGDASGEGPGDDGVYVLAIDPTGTGSGTVLVEADEFECRFMCEMQKFPGDVVVMEAVPAEGSFFFGWGGACEPEGDGPVCDVTMDQDERVTAEFRAKEAPLTLLIDPVPLGGTITGPGIDCGDDSDGCASAGASGYTVEIEAAPSPHFEFGGWTGDCAGSSGTTCRVLLDGDKRVSAHFNPLEKVFELTVEVDGNGGGEIGFPNGERCPIAETCDQRFPAGEEVTMTALPSEGSYISEWGYGLCEDYARTCTVVMNGDVTIQPFLHVKDLEFILRVEPPTGGTIRSGDIECGVTGDDCRADYQREDTTRLEAVPGDGYAFEAWGGDCSASTTPVCDLEFFDHKEVSATFRPE